MSKKCALGKTLSHSNTTNVKVKHKNSNACPPITDTIQIQPMLRLNARQCLNIYANLYSNTTNVKVKH